MGKHKRTKRREKKKVKESGSKENQALKGPAIVQRIRHSDNRTRHAALTAITGHTKLQSATLQAVRDCLADKDIECAIAATQCLVMYLQGCSPENMNHQVSAGWLIILVGRLKECYDRTEGLDGTASNQLWTRLASVCTQCIVVLVEVNNIALDRLIPDSNHTAELRNECTAVLTAWLVRSINIMASSIQSFDYVEISMWSARFFHSAWDDNPDLILPFIREEASASEHTLASLQTAISSYSSVCSLHAAGALLSLWTICTQYASETSDAILPKLEGLLDDLIGAVKKGLTWDENRCQAQLERLLEINDKREEERRDAEMEDDVVNVQIKKKEPARKIARRLKKQEADSKESPQHSGKLSEERTDFSAAYDQALEEWETATRPLQLALEIAANLSSAPETPDSMSDCSASLNDQLASRLVRNDIPLRFWELLRPWTTYTMFPVEAVQSLATDIQAKAALCLGHCVATIPQWSPPPTIWDDLRLAFQKTTQLPGREALCSCLCMIYNSRQPQIDNSSWEFLLPLAASETNSTVARDSVVIVGRILSSRPHSVELNIKTASLWKGVAQNPNTDTTVLVEILNGLMDVYGDDEVHPQVFETLELLRVFQDSIPLLKRRISLAPKDSELEIEAWKEAARNAGQFVLYKKGHLQN